MQFPAILRRWFLAATLLLSVSTASAQSRPDLEALRDARVAREQGDFVAALGHINPVIERLPEWIPAYLERATIYFEARHGMQAWDDTVTILKLDPKASGVYPLRAKIRLVAADYEGALVDAGRPGPADEMAEVRAAARMALGRYTEAKADLEFLRSGRFGPYTKARYPLAVCALAEGQVAEAVAAFKHDYADGGAPMSRWCMILGLVMLGEFEAADDDLDAWIGIAAGPAPKEDYERGEWEVLKANLNAADYLQGVVSFATGDFYGAKTSLAKVPLASENGESAVLLRHLALLRDKQPSDLTKRVGEFRQPWNLVVARFLIGIITEKEFMRTAADLRGLASNDVAKWRRQECEAGFFAGQKRLLAGDDSAAALFFEKAVATKMVEEEEYALARVALQPPNEAAKGGD